MPIRVKGENRKDKYLRLLSKLPKGSVIEVEWEDASESRLDFIPKNVEELDNKVVETRQHEIGWILGVRSGRKWRTPILIYVYRYVDGDVVKSAVSSIPISYIRKIRMHQPVHELKASKDSAGRLLEREVLNLVRMWRKRKISFDGGEKILRWGRR